MRKGFIVIVILVIFLVVRPVLSFNDKWNYEKESDIGDLHAIEPPVHQYLCYQAYLRLNEDMKSKFEKYIGSEDKCVSNECGDNSIGETITEGSYEEDRMGIYLRHFWDPDNNRGLCLPAPGFCYQNAYERAIDLWEMAIYNYINKSDYKKAYYYLGSVAHILEDMSVPAHVHLDPHGGPFGYDSYEDYIAIHYRDYDISDIDGITINNSPYGLFYSMAEITDDFDSDDVCGEVDGCSRIWRCNQLGFCDIDAGNCSEIGEILMPATIGHIVGLYRLFWITVNENIESCGMDGDKIGEDNDCCDKNLKIVDRTCLEEKFFVNINVKGRSVSFKIKISDRNFNKVEYFDKNDKRPGWKILCRRLKNGICEKATKFREGRHELLIRVYNKEGDFLEKGVSFEIEKSRRR